MRVEPAAKRTIAFFDAQNLFRSAKDAFGYQFPNYDPLALASHICASRNWQLEQIRFYTGISDQGVDPNRYHFWVAKLAALGSRGVFTFSRPLRYRNQLVTDAKGCFTTALVGQEKGVDVRIALDIVRLAIENKYDVVVIFSQDQDFTEAIADVRKISLLQDRWIRCACAFPISPASKNPRGINNTDWIKMDRISYDGCLDPVDYRQSVHK